MTIVKIVCLGAGLALLAYLFGAFCAATLNIADWPVAGRGWTAAIWLGVTVALIIWMRKEVYL